MLFFNFIGSIGVGLAIGLRVGFGVGTRTGVGTWVNAGDGSGYLGFNIGSGSV